MANNNNDASLAPFRNVRAMAQAISSQAAQIAHVMDVNGLIRDSRHLAREESTRSNQMATTLSALLGPQANPHDVLDQIVTCSNSLVYSDQLFQSMKARFDNAYNEAGNEELDNLASALYAVSELWVQIRTHARSTGTQMHAAQIAPSVPAMMIRAGVIVQFLTWLHNALDIYATQLGA